MQILMDKKEAKGKANHIQEEEKEDGEDHPKEEVEVPQMEGEIRKINNVTTVTNLGIMRGSVEQRILKKVQV